MRRVSTSAFEIAHRYVGVAEIAGEMDNPLVLAMLRLDASWPQADEVPWCSAFVNWIAWHLHLPRSKSLRARSWLEVGLPVSAEEAEPGGDVVVLQRGGGDQPGPEVLEAPGHVGFFAGFSEDGASWVHVLGGNQGDRVSVSPYPAGRVLAYRRIA